MQPLWRWHPAALQPCSKVGRGEAAAGAGGVDSRDRRGDADAVVGSDQATISATFHDTFATGTFSKAHEIRARAPVVLMGSLVDIGCQAPV